MQSAEANPTTVPTDERSDPRSDMRVPIVWWVFPDTSGSFKTRLDRPSSTVGRDPTCSTCLPGAQLSRLHASFRKMGPVAVLHDEDSRNGSFVNGHRIHEHPLKPGDIIRFGEWVGIVRQAPLSCSDDTHVVRELAPGIVGGPSLAAVLDDARKVAVHDLPVLLEGETGTGKEVLARSIHAWSRRPGRMVAINCAALPEPLAEAELFGFRQGAFTGAVHGHEGLLRAAERGTLLFDEVAELALPLQAKLLRVIEDGEIRGLGGATTVRTSVRYVSAAQRPLEALVREGRFREDLFARLSGALLRIPPLRDRAEEIPALFASFLARHARGKPPTLDAALVEQLCLMPWPRNVRQLDLLTRQLLALHGHEPRLRAGHLPDDVAPSDQADPPRQPTKRLPHATRPPVRRASHADDRTDRQRLLDFLRAERGNVSRAAAAAGISRQRAYRILQDDPTIDLDRLRESPLHGGDGA